MNRTTAALVGLLAMAVPGNAGEPVDLALVLAIDVSGSVSRPEYEMQTHGIAAAFRDPEIIAAIGSGRYGRIAVNLMSWGDPDYEKLTSGWYSVNGRDSSLQFAAMAQNFEGRTGGGTGIGLAVAYGITLINLSGYEASRKVVDVSGDGFEMGELRDPHFKLPDAQAIRKREGVIVNGLAIANDEPGLGDYYRQNVAGGPGSFVIEISRYEDYADAIRRKLLREIQPNVSALPPRGQLARQ